MQRKKRNNRKTKKKSAQNGKSTKFCDEPKSKKELNHSTAQHGTPITKTKLKKVKRQEYYMRYA